MEPLTLVQDNVTWFFQMVSAAADTGGLPLVAALSATACLVRCRPYRLINLLAGRRLARNPAATRERLL